jgi:hypothetical protein
MKPLLLAVVFLGIAVFVLRRTDPERVDRDGMDGVQPVDPRLEGLVFQTLVCGVAVCGWSGPREDFDTHPHRSW